MLVQTESIKIRYDQAQVQICARTFSILLSTCQVVMSLTMTRFVISISATRCIHPCSSRTLCICSCGRQLVAFDYGITLTGLEHQPCTVHSLWSQTGLVINKQRLHELLLREWGKLDALAASYLLINMQHLMGCLLAGELQAQHTALLAPQVEMQGVCQRSGPTPPWTQLFPGLHSYTGRMYCPGQLQHQHQGGP